MAAAFAAHDGWHVTWLGADLPATQVAAGAELGNARLVALSVASYAPGLDRELSTLRARLQPHVPLGVGGTGAARLREAAGVTRVRDLAHWRALLSTHLTSSQD